MHPPDSVFRLNFWIHNTLLVFHPLRHTKERSELLNQRWVTCWLSSEKGIKILFPSDKGKSQTETLGDPTSCSPPTDTQRHTRRKCIEKPFLTVYISRDLVRRQRQQKKGRRSIGAAAPSITNRSINELDACVPAGCLEVKLQLWLWGDLRGLSIKVQFSAWRKGKGTEKWLQILPSQ